MILFRSILFNIVFLVWSTLVGIAMLPILLMGAPAMRRGCAWWIWTVVWLLRVIANIRYELRGLEHIPDTPAIFASKHQSAWETLFLTAYFKNPAVVSKRELKFVPFYGLFAIRAGMIWVNRSQGVRAIRPMIHQTLDALKRGRNVVVFPQGTRTAPGTRPPYQPGIAALYVGASAPVVPVALNSGMFWGRHSFHKNPGTIVVEFFEPIPPGLDRKTFLEVLSERIETATTRLEEEASAAHQK
ncbi:MAG: lysophospholipid acyltransferase family protein [Alphaproteobacteria bacterium]